MKKRFALAVIVITAIALSLVGCHQKRGRRSRFNDLHRPLFVKAFARRNVEKNRWGNSLLPHHE